MSRVGYFFPGRIVAATAAGIVLTALPLLSTTTFAAGGYVWSNPTSGIGAQCSQLAASYSGEILACANTSGDIITSSDYGKTWVDQAGSGSADWIGVAVSGNGQYVVGLNAAGVAMASSDSGSSWATLNTGGGGDGIGISETGQYMSISFPDGIANSSDYGATWSAGPDAAAGDLVQIVRSANGQYGLTGDKTGSALDETINYGGQWNLTSTGNPNWYGVSMSASGQYMLAGTQGDSLYESTDYGQDWAALPNTNNGGTWNYVHISDNGQDMVAIDSTSGGSLYESTDGGQTFSVDTIVPSNGWSALAVSADSSRVVAQDSTGAIRLGYDAALDTSIPVSSGGTNNNPVTNPTTQLTDTGIDVGVSALIAAMLLVVGIWIYRQPTAQ